MLQNVDALSVFREIWQNRPRIVFGSERKFKVHGALDLELRDCDGKLKQHIRKDNLIVDAGFDLICNAIGATSGRPAIISHIGVGTSSTAAAAGQTALVAQHADGRQAATFAHTTGTKVFTMAVTIAAGTCTGALTEAGVFNASSSGSMLDRVVFSVINKGASDTLTPTFTFTLS